MTVFTSLCVGQDLEVTNFAPVVVQGLQHGTDADLMSAQRSLRNIPGNVSIVQASEFRDAEVMGVRDVLSRVPGVYAQNPSGQISAKVSIRGSGLSASSGMRGIRLLRDGLPLGRADDLGESIYADPFGASYIEIFRGASSLQYGAATLGGAINLVSPTAYSHPGHELRVDGGLNNYTRAQFRAGKIFENGLDAYASVSRVNGDGFRQNSAHTAERFYGNVGYRFSPESEGRLHITLERYHVDMPGAITLDQLQSDPSVANPTHLMAHAQIRTTPRWHLAYQHDWLLGLSDKFSLGTFHTGTKFDSQTQLGVHYDAVDYGVSMRHEINRELSGHDNQFIWGASFSRGTSHNQTHTPDYWPGAFMQLESIDAARSTVELFAENSFKVSPDLALIAGAQATWARRRTDNQALTPLGSLSYPAGQAYANYSGFNPKLGVVWDVGGDNAQIFANISRSFEPPNSVAFHTRAGKLSAQRATTFEIGTRGGDAQFGWDLALYKSWLKDELLEMPVPGNPAAPPMAYNVASTRHTGLELGLHGEFKTGAVPGKIAWNLAYTWNHFRFHNNERYGNNALPGIPEHLARLDLVYHHPDGFYGGPNFEFASGWDVDQANTLVAPGYGIINFTLGYAAPKDRYRVFIDVRNLADKYYATSTDYMVDARYQPQNVFYPGQTRTVFAGLQLNW
ncbi:TonB-dependent receptor [Pusillimonas sp. MFBS29]|uniref:TonB-dependent receptor family protein n=1 Tax=Pusillimonas sp. MFBS29 TaxID=2886690 RepID=UPI001D0FF479|nr:TonB-dependent receptor [Pusillimonas sp. MFBS29]MCC2595226.1 TonB-dependent receptor [Pusillimonas sp. MFBS29]